MGGELITRRPKPPGINTHPGGKKTIRHSTLSSISIVSLTLGLPLFSIFAGGSYHIDMHIDMIAAAGEDRKQWQAKR
jgi:hypothetical protein